MSLFDFRNLFNQCLSHAELLYDIKSYEKILLTSLMLEIEHGLCACMER